jgi:hypothetical protein
MLFLIGFFFGVIWLVNYFRYRNSRNENAKGYAKYSLLGFVVTTVVSLAFFIGIMVITGTNGAGIYY